MVQSRNGVSASEDPVIGIHPRSGPPPSGVTGQVTERASSGLEDLAEMPVEEVSAWPVGALSGY
jgi:hypothetical protein